MSVTTEKSFFTAARSRRLACDRCHRHKLRCERSPVVVNGGITVPLGSCKRCMKARVPCQTVSGTFSTAGSTAGSGSPKRKSHLAVRGEEENGEAPFGVVSDAALFQGTPEETGQGTASPYVANSPPSFDSTEPSMFNGDAFDLMTGEFNGVDSAHATSSSGTLSSPTFATSPLKSYSLLLDDESGAVNNTQIGIVEDAAEARTQCMGFVDATLCGVLGCQGHNDQLNSNECGTGSTGVESLREECRQRLVELHTLLFNELQCITHADLVDILFPVDSPSLGSRDKPGPGNSVLPRVLFASERLIELLGLIRAAGPSGRTGSWRYEAWPSRCERGDPTAVVRHSIVPHGTPTGTTTEGDIASIATATTNGSPVGDYLLIDLPIVISFLTCYVGVLSVYRAIFTHIHEALLASEPIRRPSLNGRHQMPWTAPTPAHSPALRGLHEHETCSQYASLISQHTLGIRIQMEIMTHMLEQIADAWANVQAVAVDAGSERTIVEAQDGQEGTAGEGGYESFLDSPATIALLSQMLLHEGYSHSDHMSEGCRMGLGSLMSLQRNIRRLLRSGSFCESF
ncbi:hypothetical protein VTK26DRAFT_6234 [Humicola hyalothermophila]